MNSLEWKKSNNLIAYPEALEFMEQRVNQIINNKSSELIWLLEHSPIYTAGTSAKNEELLSTALPVFQTGRGGKYTYHGPGQRVIYPMLDLKMRAQNDKPDLRKFIFNLEEWVIETLKELGIKGERRKDRIGIWVANKNKETKIAAIGVRIRKWVSYHGIAINVAPNLDHFSGIIPCGINEFGVTSLKNLGIECSIDELDIQLKKTFGKIF